MPILSLLDIYTRWWRDGGERDDYRLATSAFFRKGRVVIYGRWRELFDRAYPSESPLFFLNRCYPVPAPSREIWETWQIHACLVVHARRCFPEKPWMAGFGNTTESTTGSGGGKINSRRGSDTLSDLSILSCFKA
jgi:hypothetical protein